MAISAKTPLRQQIMDGDNLRRTLSRIVHQLLERNKGSDLLALAGIRTRGVYLAQRMASMIKEIEGHAVPVGSLDITLYRDDLTMLADLPVVKKTELPYDVAGKIIILVDDVLFTGRTVRAALDEIIDFGRPKSIQLAVLVDRGHRELPIQADYVGHPLSTTREEVVEVLVREVDKEDAVYLARKGAQRGSLNGLK